MQASPLITPLLLKKELIASFKHLSFVEKTRQQIVDILTGKDNRRLLILGPCSIHDLTSAKEYALNLSRLAREVSDSFLLVMRTYFEKPRTVLGWKGMLYDPHLNGSNDINSGLSMSRQLLLLLAEMEVPAATEFLDPFAPHFFGDLISWACIGARTAESQTHRQFASGLKMPIAFKNNTAGNIEIAIHGVLTAKSPHSFFGIQEDGHIAINNTEGNPHTHVALRGGESQPNFDEKSIKEALKLLQKAQLPQQLIIDCSHDNSCRLHENQPTVFKSVINQCLKGNKGIRGLILESHLESGNQSLPKNEEKLKYAVSLTDPCLDWKVTKDLVLWAHEKFLNQETALNPKNSLIHAN